MLRTKISKQEFTKTIIGVVLGMMIFGYCTVRHENRKTDPAPKPPVSHADATPLTGPGTAMKSLHPDWTNTVCNAVAERRLTIGMNVDQMVLSWGQPSDVNTTHNTYGDHSQWIYRGQYSSDRYVYTTNGIITSWQE